MSDFNKSKDDEGENKENITRMKEWKSEEEAEDRDDYYFAAPLHQLLFQRI